MCTTTDFTPQTALPAPVMTSPVTTKRRRKTVSFFPKVTVKYGIHVTEYTAAERNQTWLSKDELQLIRIGCHKIAREFSRNDAPSNGISHNGVDIIRGLEGKTVQGLARRKHIKTVARNAVFDEQNFQIRTGMADADAIANAYYEHSEYPQIDAHMKALRDQVEALVVTPPPKRESTKRDSSHIITTPTAITAVTCRPRFLTSSSSRRLLTNKFFNF